MRCDIPDVSAVEDTDTDWDAIMAYLPSDWEDAAKRLGAFTRSRSFSSPATLLRTLFLHLAEGCSLRETSIRAKRSGLADVSDVAILKRLRASEAWLHYLAASLTTIPSGFSHRFHLCMVDATVISEPGSTGTDWRLHYMLDASSLNCLHFELTDVHTGESFRRFPVQPNDLLVGDRGYESIAAIQYVRDRGGEVVVRIRPQGRMLNTPEGQPFDCMREFARIAIGCESSWPVLLKNRTGGEIPGRICVYRLEPAKAEVARKKARRESIRKSHIVRESTLEAANYVALFTTVEQKHLSLHEVFEVYRLRWQIELAFKRLKSLTGFGYLPKHDPVSCRAWLYGKLLVGLLIESMMRIPFSP